MNTRNSKDASFGFETWSLIDWGEVERSVRSTQIKIAEATKTEDWKRVSKLQNGLVRSLKGKLLAVKVVTSNTGRNTSGVDGIIWDTDEKKMSGALSLTRKGYKPLPLRRVEIPKANGKKRPLGIPTIKDRAMQCLYKLALEPVAEVMADTHSYGFRPKRSCQDVQVRCHTIFSGRNGAEWVLEGDIKSCFDKISHEWLLDHVHMDKGILAKWLKAGFIFNGGLFPTDEGTPQGGVISPILANMALDGIEDLLDREFGKRTSPRRKKAKLNFVRYADDFIISGSSREMLELEVIPVLNEFLGDRGLELSAEKTKVTHIKDGFDFLGFNFRKYSNEVFLTKPSKEKVKGLLRRIKDIFKSNMSSKQRDVIKIVNPILSGWCNYYKHVVSKETFSYIDSRIWEMCWRWSVRRHHNKGKKWIKNRYFIRFKGRDWRFVDTSKIPHEFLKLASYVSIRRHVKIRGDAEIFNPDWDAYFEERC